MKSALPEHAKLSKESKVCIQECVSEFISFITSQAVDRCKVEKRKTLNGEDILWAMYTLGFENYSETLKIYLAKFREHEQLEAERRPPRRNKRKLPESTQNFAYDSDEILSEDISPGISDSNSLSRHVTQEYSSLPPTQAVNIVETAGPDFKYDFNDPSFTNFNLNQRQNSINYMLMPDTRQNSIKPDNESELPNFEGFGERM